MELLNDTAAVVLFPLPCLLQEFIASQIMLVYSLALQLINNFNLCGDGGVIRSRLP